MEKEFLPGSIGRSISNRVGFTSDFFQKLAQQDKLDNELKEQLFDLVPPGLCDWISDNDILDTLFKYGKCSLNIYLKDGVRGDLKELSTAWKDIVSFSFGKFNDRKANINLSVTI